MSLKTRLSVLLLSTPVLAFVLVGGLLGQRPAAAGDQSIAHLRVFHDVFGLVLDNYVTEVEPDRVMEGALRGLADGLDPDSAYLTPSLVRAVESSAAQTAGADVGIELTRQYWLRVIAARDGSPAAEAGLQTGDYIRAIGGKTTRDMSVFEGNRLLRGQPGSKVTLTIIRGNAADPHDLTLVREKIPTAQVTSRIIAAGIGYARVLAFRNGIDAELRRHATELTKNGATRLIVDLRRTAEGPLENGIAAARIFVGSGTLAQKATRDESAREVITAQSGDGAVQVPVTILATTGTSGAAELFIAALDGNGRAEIVGERTLGRAGVQRLVKLPEGRGLWLTYARYLRPDGEPIQGRGLEPDLQVEEPSVEFGAPAPEGDPILDAALERIKTKAAA